MGEPSGSSFDNPIFEKDGGKEVSQAERQKESLKKGEIVCNSKNLMILAFIAACTITAVCLITFFAATDSNSCPAPATPEPTTKPTTQPTTQPPSEREEVCTAEPEWYRSSCINQYDECPEENMVRLPRDLLPTHYNIELKPDIYTADTADFNFWGKVTIDMEAKAHTSYIQLNYNQYQIDDSTLKVTKDGNDVEVLSIHRNNTLDQDLYLVEIQQLYPGEQIQVSMEYGGPLQRIPSSGRGFYWCDYFVNNQWKYMVATQLESVFARELYPCVDDPAVKATYAMSIWRKSPMVSLFNMPASGSPENKGNGWMVDHYDTTPLMSTYLVAMIVGEYKAKISPSQNGHDVKIWGPVEYIDAGYADYPSEITGKALDYYDTQFGYTYPLPKLDVALVPDKSGAMENWGLILSGNYAAMFDDSISGEDQKRSHSSTMHHEIVHLWFGDLVTCEWWSDIWVNEAYASFYSPFPWSVSQPDWDMQTYQEERGYTYMIYEETGTRHAAHNPGVNTKSEAINMFTTVTYGRTALVLKMMRHLIMTSAQWDAAMTRYLQNNQYGSGNYRRIFEAIDQITGTNHEVPPSVAMDTYIRQMGHPVVTITTNRGSKHVDATQKLFLQDDYSGVRDEQNPSPFGYKWYIPIKYITSTDHSDKMIWMKLGDMSWELDAELNNMDWFLANHDHYGFFRVNYDLNNWHALIHQLHMDHTAIEERDRGALIIDSFQLARAGELDYIVPLHMSQYLTKETTYLPFAAMSYFVDSYLESNIKLMDSFGSYRQYMRSLWRPLHESLGWDQTGAETEKYISMRLRRYAMDWSCYYGNTECIEEAVKRVTDYKNDPTNHKGHVSPDMHVTVFCTAVEHETGSDLWEFVWNLFISWLHDDMKEERRAFLRDALYCTRNKDNLTTLFDTVMGDQTGISSSDRSSIANGIARNPVGHMIVAEYLWNNWNDDHPFRESLLRSITQYFSTPQDLLWIQQRMTDLQINVNDKGLYDSVSTTIERKIRFRERDGQTIEDFFYGVTKEYRPEEVPGETLLPRHVVPTNYELFLAPDFYHNDPVDFKSWGAAHISFLGVQPSDALFFHYRYINIDHSTVEVTSKTKPNLAIHVNRVQVISTAADSVLAVYLSREIAAGENVTIGMDFDNIIRANDTRAGFYWSLYHDENLNPKYMMGTQLQASRADWIFPCMDEVGLQATYTIHLLHEQGYLAQTNMPEESLDATITAQWMLDLFTKYNMDSTGWEMTNFQTSPVMQPYLLSLAISDFKYTDAPVEHNHFNVRVYAQPKFIDAGFAVYGARASGMQLDMFSSTFNFDYPLPKLDSIVVPDRTGAMENWGLITYAGYYMLIDPELSDIYDYYQVARVVGHEQAHLWFGDLVTCKYWNDIFIHESYASFYEHWGVKHVEPDWDTDQLHFRSRFLSALNSDSYGTSMPLHKQTWEEDSTWGTILYYKGSSVLRMFDRLLMKDHWNETHELFINRHQFQNADYYDYLDAYDTIDRQNNLNESIGVRPSLMVRTWMEQAGYPTVTFSPIPGTNRLKVSQKRFLLRPNKPTKEWYPQEFGYKWEVPLVFDANIAAAGGRDTYDNNHWLHQTDGYFTLNGNFDAGNDWILGNLEAKGFYRVNYDVSNWQALIKQLKADHTVIDVKNRAMLLDDSSALARAGDLDQVLAFQVTEYLAAETEYAPWYSLSYTGDFQVKKMLPSFTSYEKFRGYMRNQLDQAYTAHGWVVAPGETIQKRMARMLTKQMACDYDHSDCVAQATDLWNQWKANPTNDSTIHPDLRDAVFCTAIKHSTDLEGDWDFLFQKYLDYVANDHFCRMRTQTRDALACFTDKAYLDRYWRLGVERSDMIDSRDHYSVLDQIARNMDGGQELAWEKLMNEWDTNPWRTSLYTTLSGYFNTEEQYNWQQEFFTSKSTQFSAETQEDLNGNVRANIIWRTTNEAEIELWLATVPQK